MGIKGSCCRGRIKIYNKIKHSTNKKEWRNKTRKRYQ